jgi:hypothetical protein
MKELYLKKNNDISRTPTATCIFDNNDVEGMKYMEKMYSNNIFDEDFINENNDDSSVFGEYQKAGIIF